MLDLGFRWWGRLRLGPGHEERREQGAREERGRPDDAFFDSLHNARWKWVGRDSKRGGFPEGKAQRTKEGKAAKAARV